jgi:hypothetical protein
MKFTEEITLRCKMVSYGSNKKVAKNGNLLKWEPVLSIKYLYSRIISYTVLSIAE